jgi:hypothetical protein
MCIQRPGADRHSKRSAARAVGASVRIGFSHKRLIHRLDSSRRSAADLFTVTLYHNSKEKIALNKHAHEFTAITILSSWQ